MSEVRVRWAVEADDQVLLEIERSAWDASSGFPSFTEGLGDRFFARSGPEVHLVAEYGGAVVGYLRLQDKYPFPEGTGVLAVNGLAVAHSARGRGVASTLITAAVDESRRRGARKLSLNVHAVNAAARRLYERHGFVVEGFYHDEFIIEGTLIDALAMAKTL